MADVVLQRGQHVRMDVAWKTAASDPSMPPANPSVSSSDTAYVTVSAIGDGGYNLVAVGPDTPGDVTITVTGDDIVTPGTKTVEVTTVAADHVDLTLGTPEPAPV